MQLLGLLKIEAFKRTQADARGPLEIWQAEVEKAQWGALPALKVRYRNVGIETDNRVVFNIKTPTNRLVIRTKYKNGIVLIEWVGTQAEYARTRSLAGGGGQGE